MCNLDNLDRFRNPERCVKVTITIAGRGVTESTEITDGQVEIAFIGSKTTKIGFDNLKKGLEFLNEIVEQRDPATGLVKDIKGLFTSHIDEQDFEYIKKVKLKIEELLSLNK